MVRSHHDEKAASWTTGCSGRGAIGHKKKTILPAEDIKMAGGSCSNGRGGITPRHDKKTILPPEDLEDIA
jgi:hypothetical protein